MGTTPLLNLPWPDGPVDPVSGGAGDIQALAEALDPLLRTVVTNPTEIGLRPATNWGFTLFQAVRTAGMVSLSARMSYTGPTITGGSSGNIGDVAIAAGLSAEWAPSMGTYCVFEAGGFYFGNAVLSAAGQLSLQTLTATGEITGSDNAVDVNFCYAARVPDIPVLLEEG